MQSQMGTALDDEVPAYIIGGKSHGGSSNTRAAGVPTFGGPGKSPKKHRFIDKVRRNAGIKEDKSPLRDNDSSGSHTEMTFEDELTSRTT